MDGNGARSASCPVLTGPKSSAASRMGRLPRSLVCGVTALALALAPISSSSALDPARLQQAAAAQGVRAERSAQELRELVVALQPMVDGDRIERVNLFVNRRVSFVSDTVAWGQADYWSTPLETLSRGLGDCEDYAIAKYFILTAAGMPASRLRLVYVRALLPASASAPAVSQAHMVLAYYADNEAEPQILDNLVSDIRPASKRSDLTPVFSFNGEGLWTGAGSQPAGDPRARLSRWRDVLLKARAEGFE